MVHRGANKTMAIKPLNNRGIFFTIVIITMMSLFLVTYLLATNTNNKTAETKRVKTLNNFIFSIEEDLSRQLYISGYRALFVMQKEAIEEGNYIANVNDAANELMMNGTYELVSQAVMVGTTLSDIAAAIAQKAAKVNANITLYNPKITMNQSDPWYVDVVLTTDFSARDRANLVTWNESKTFRAQIPLEELEDPIYVIGTAGLVTNKIQKSNRTMFVNGADVSELVNHATSGHYIATADAPSYINRLEGTDTPSQFGIESIVNPQKLSSQGVSVEVKSLIDFEYFSANNPTYCQITGAPSWLRISQTSLAHYNATGLEYNCI
jgi:hypothetical protein